MAADTLCLEGSARFYSLKIVEHHGYLLGAAGEPPPVAGLIRWYFQALGKPIRPKVEGGEFSLLVVTPKRRIQMWDNRGSFEPIRHRFWAIGSGAEACLGAMQVGASAAQAVASAIKWANGCGGRVTVRRL